MRRCNEGASPAFALGFGAASRSATTSVLLFPSILNHPELHPARFTDHVLVPWRIPDELDFGFVDAVDRKNLALRVVRDGGAHAAAGGGERHFDVHFHPAFRTLCQLTIVNQAEIDDIHRN